MSQGYIGYDLQFQSTPPRGWRRKGLHYLGSGLLISIHSTTRVETEDITINVPGLEISIHSTTRVETG